jgi:hypothetical protein
MATGYEGSTLVAELNRLANSGTYPTRDNFLAEGGAAAAWAGIPGYDLLGSLNLKADPSRTRDNFKDLNGICNELASTTGLEAVTALRSINA